MMSDNMTDIRLESLLQPRETIDHNGIHIAKGIADRTVWDVHAEDNPTFAVISAANETEAKEKSRPQIEDIKRYVKSTDVVLDLGTGYGRVAQYLLPQQSLAGYVGLDSSLEMLTLFKQRYVRSDSEQQTPVLFVQSDIHTIPLETASVDVILVCAVFLHNHKDIVAKSMAEVKRVLKPGGTLLVYSSFPRKATLMGVQGITYQAILNLMGTPYKNGPVRYYSQKEVTTLLAGFEQVTFVPFGFAILPKTLIFLPGPLEKLYRLGIANPVNNFLEKLCSPTIKAYCAMFYDIVAKR
jgi:ubiquinone/menaquinone biosynthesis C-methylase UbiE